jgi:anti-sigma factor RsiW
MNLEQIEFALSQYLDGTLDDASRAAVEQRLRADPQAQQLLEEYRKLDRALKNVPAAPPMAVRWDRLAERISESVADRAYANRLSIAWRSWPVRLAAAAAVLLAFGLIRFWLPGTAGQPAAAPAVVSVIGPQAPPAGAERIIIDVSVGQPQPAGAGQFDALAGQGLLVQRSEVALNGFTQTSPGAADLH